MQLIRAAAEDKEDAAVIAGDSVVLASATNKLPRQEEIESLTSRDDDDDATTMLQYDTAGWLSLQEERKPPNSPKATMIRERLRRVGDLVSQSSLDSIRRRVMIPGTDTEALSLSELIRTHQWRDQPVRCRHHVELSI